MMKTKILEEALLYEDEDEDEEGNIEDVYESEEEGEEEGEYDIEPERVGPDGAIYASSSSGEEVEENEEG
jgi:hypothetical protein